MSAKSSSMTENLRIRAEELLAQVPENFQPKVIKDINKLHHELAVHQVELELQNEELRNTQFSLQKACDRYSELYEKAPVGYVLLDASGIIRRANSTWSAMLGRPDDDFRGTPFAETLLEDDARVFLSRFRSFFHNPAEKQMELRIQRNNYELLHVQITARRTYDERAENDTNELMVIVSDITERKKAEDEREKLQSQLIQAQKMESVGRLAGGVAHDFNNMLTVIIGHATMLLAQMKPDQPFHDDLMEIKMAGERSAKLTRQLLAFARKQVIAPKVIDLNETVESILKMLGRLIGDDIDLSWRPGKEVWPVKMDPAQIDQILANLCVNSRDAIADVGKVTIETGKASFDEEYCARHEGFVSGDYVLLTVSDNGCGMNAETISHLFEPFFTTKEFGKGTGLGLATVYGVVKQNQGFINVYSEPGQGTTFKVYLPRHAGGGHPPGA